MSNFDGTGTRSDRLKNAAGGFRLDLKIGNVRNIIVLRALPGLGDMLCLVPAARSLRRALPHARITLLGLPSAEPFAQRFRHYFDEFLKLPAFPGIWEAEDHTVRELPSFLAAVQQREYDLALQLHGSGTISNTLISLIGAKRTAGFFEEGRYRPENGLFFEYPGNLSEIRRNLALLQHLGIPCSGEHLEFPLASADFGELDRVEGAKDLRPNEYVCIHPGAKTASRRWLPERFAAVADELARHDLKVVLTGRQDEAALNEAVAQAMHEPCVNLACDMSAGALAALLSRARLVVSNDTGVSHLAAALRVPSVVIFSAADPVRWAPLDTRRHRAIFAPVDCRPCSYEECPIHHPCVENVETEAVLAPALELLESDWLQPRDDWKHVRKLLAIRLGPPEGVIQCGPALRALREALPEATITLASTAAGSAAVPLLPWVDDSLILRSAKTKADGIFIDPFQQSEFIGNLASRGFDGAILFTNPRQSPYSAAYACALAGIPLRAAQSMEFGGALLTDWVRCSNLNTNLVNRHLDLVEDLGFQVRRTEIELRLPSQARAEADASLRQVGLGLDQPFLLFAAPHRVQAEATGIIREELGELWRLLDGARLAAQEAKLPLAVVANGPEREAISLVFGSADVRLLPPLNDFSRLAALISAASLLFTGRPSLVSIADAFRIPILCVRPPARPLSQWAPLVSPFRVPAPEAPPKKLAETALSLLDLGAGSFATASQSHSTRRIA